LTASVIRQQPTKNGNSASEGSSRDPQSFEISATSARRAESRNQEMTHRFKLGEMDSPSGRRLLAADGAYSITGILPENDGQPEYRIKHFSEDYERVAQEGELSPGAPSTDLDDKPT
jgi:hypothetical protein